MSRPFRRYCFHLAEKLGKDVDEILNWSSDKLSEWMAFDLSNNEEWSKTYHKEQELERQRSLSNSERAALIKQLLGGNNGDNS